MPKGEGWTRVRSVNSMLNKCVHCKHLGNLIHQAKTKKDRNTWTCNKHHIPIGENDYSCDQFERRTYQREDVPEEL